MILRIVVRLGIAIWALLVTAGALSPSPARADSAAPVNASFRALVASAQSSAMADRPDAALAYYTLALSAARGNEPRQRAALFGMGRMLVWLGRYVKSESVYRRLLATTLSREDRDIALVGLVKSLAYEGRPMAAYAVGSSVPATTNPELVIETAQAATWAGWPDKADSLLTNSAPVLGSIDPNSRLAKALRSVRRELSSNLGPLITFGFNVSNDSDGLHIGTTNAVVNARAGKSTVARVSFDRVALWQNAWSAAGTLISVGASGRLGDHTWIDASLGSENYPGWQTGTYDSGISYRPSDRYGFRAFGSREVVQSQVALTRHLTSSLRGLGGDVALGSQATLMGSLYRQNFADGNSRTGISGKIGSVIIDSAGLSGHLSWRSFSNTAPGSVAYFDPQHYSEVSALLTESRRIGADWHISVTGGIGRQSVSPGGASTTASYDASVVGHTQGCIEARASFDYSNSALAAISGYQRHAAGISVNCTF